MLHCSPCGKIFTGRVSYDQHIESDKHKRKVLSSSVPNNQITASVNLTDRITATEVKCDKINCHVCNISFNSIESFQSHSVTPEHALKIMLKNSEGSVNCSIISSSSSSLNNHKLNDIGNKTRSHDEDETGSTDKDEIILPGFNDQKKPLYLSYGSCDVCKKNFSGPEPYRQHLQSSLHKKKVELQANPPVAGMNLNSIFTCEPCKKTFSGQVPYMQHMTSETHKKKLQHFQDFQNFLSEVDSSSRMEKNDMGVKESEIINPWFCKICNTQCSGMVPYEQHLQGSTHLKNERRAQFQQSSFKLEDFVKPVMQGINYVNKVSEKSESTSQLVSESNQNDDKKMEKDQILEEVVHRLNVMSTDELEQSIKIFVPDAKIDFNELEYKMHTDSADENVSHDDSEQNQGEVKEKSEIYQVCNLCNVKLLNKDDAAHHYESLEHFSKRWGSN